MRLTRVYTDAGLYGPGRATLAGTAAAHVSRVLRLRVGDAVTLFNGDGWEYPGVITAVRGGHVDVELQARMPGLPDSPVAVTLLQGVARAERMDLVIQKATELGVARILPVLAERGVVRLDERQGGRKLAHWRAIAASACEQCGRSRLPVIEEPCALDAAVAAVATAPRRLLLTPGAADALAGLPGNRGGVALLIGPEGGLTEAEESLAMHAGFRRYSLGPRILRTETAAIAAIAVLQATGGDLR